MPASLSKRPRSAGLRRAHSTFAPAQLPAETTARLNRAFVDALASADVRARLANLYAEPMAMAPERFAAFVKGELAKYEPLVKASGARVE